MSAKSPKKIDLQYVYNAAVYYLGRFNSTEANLRKILARKIIRRRGVSETNGYDLKADEVQLIADVIAKCRSYGYLDDKRYAEDRAQLLLQRGKAMQRIAADLNAKGISEDIARAVMADLRDRTSDADTFAAARYAKRRRFGAFKMADKTGGSEIDEKQLAAMARAGFAYDTARDILLSDIDTLMDILERAELG